MEKLKVGFVAGFMEGFSTNGLPHHFPMVMRNVAPYIEEFAYWAGLSKVRRYDYKDYLYV